MTIKNLFIISVITTLIFALLITPMLCGRMLTGTPELRLAVVAKEMLASGDYIAPTLGGEPRFNKPPLVYWLVVGAAKLLNGDACSTETCADARAKVPDQRVIIHAVQLVAALVTALSFFIISLYGCAVFGRATGILTGLIFCLSVIITKLAWLGSGDTTLMLTCASMFCAASWLICAPSAGVLCALGLGISLGLAILAKGHIALLLLLASLLLEALIWRSFNSRKALWLFLALIIAAIIATPWFLIIRKTGAWAIMQSEVQYAIWPTSHDQIDRWSYYPIKLLGGMLPWTPLLICAWPIYLFYLRPRLDRQNEALVFAYKNARFLAIAFCLGFLGFYVFPKQQEHYLLPILPPLALASAFMLSQFKTPGGFAEERLAWTQLVFGLLVAMVLTTVAFWPIDLFTRFTKNDNDIERIITLQQLWSNWHITVAIGIAFVGLYLYLTRQYVEGRALRASFVLAILIYIGMFSWCRYEYSRKPSDETVVAMPRVRAELDRFEPNIKIYAAGIRRPLLIFYLDRPILTLKSHLCKEPVGQSPEDSPQRVLVGDREAFANLKLTQYLPAGDENIMVVKLPKDVDWPQYFQKLPLKKNFE